MSKRIWESLTVEDQTASVITPYDQQENYETGRNIGRIDRHWALYDPPRNSDAAMLAGYELGWSQQDVIEREAEGLTGTDDEARFEREIEYWEAMWG